MEEPKKKEDVIVPPEYVRTLFQVFESELGELPQSIRSEIIKLCRVKQYKLTEDIIHFDH